ncbi:damage-control phosphatase ARMT1 family protein [Methyloprofundus sp.]|uniref:damage-control phosphatase ARMT1 family protein n=1 Tax=Methyloprofundus sp. TaxID=2020875 RepID=UPI003D0B7CF5
MKTYLDCYPCLMRQALSAARRAGASDNQQHSILLKTMEELSAFPTGSNPAQLAYRIHQQVQQLTNNLDPYRDDKDQATQQALALYPELKKKVSQAADPLDMAVRIAIAGNIIDLGVADSYDLEATLARVLTQAFAINDLASLRNALAQSMSVLYLADNAGETVFDRVLIETLDIPVNYVVKAGPIINDATREDAVAAGIEPVANIIDNGSNAPGTLLDQCSELFRKRFAQADLILAKGQANYESLSNSSAPIFFLLQAKCNVIARDLGVAEGGTILKQQVVD